MKEPLEMKDKVLFLCTQSYPYGKGEEFIETEIEFLSQYFKTIYIVSQSSDSNQTRSLPYNCESVLVSEKISNLNILFHYPIYHMVFKEFLNQKNKNLKTLKEIIRFAQNSYYIERKIKQVINRNHLELKNIVLYSYWFHNASLAIASIKKKDNNTRAICRAHRFDLYDYAGPQYFKTEILKSIDKVISCSKEGLVYLRNHYPVYNEKLDYSYLGTKKCVREVRRIKERERIILSVSFIRLVKRIDLLIDALSLFEKREDIKWVHIGDGEDRARLETYASECLNIDFVFKGHLTNQEVLEFISLNDIVCLINLSNSEGIPVSMMEAQSFGIPIVATSVGGVPEIVSDKNGILVDSKATCTEVYQAIKTLCDCNSEEYKIYKENSLLNWKENFNADKNYTDFIKYFLE